MEVTNSELNYIILCVERKEFFFLFFCCWKFTILGKLWKVTVRGAASILQFSTYQTNIYIGSRCRQFRVGAFHLFLFTVRTNCSIETVAWCWRGWGEEKSLTERTEPRLLSELFFSARETNFAGIRPFALLEPMASSTLNRWLIFTAILSIGVCQAISINSDFQDFEAPTSAVGAASDGVQQNFLTLSDLLRDETR